MRTNSTDQPVHVVAAASTQNAADLRCYPVPPTAMTFGENQLSITLTCGDPEATGEIVIDELEIWVQPK